MHFHSEYNITSFEVSLLQNMMTPAYEFPEKFIAIMNNTENNVTAIMKKLNVNNSIEMVEKLSYTWVLHETHYSIIITMISLSIAWNTLFINNNYHTCWRRLHILFGYAYNNDFHASFSKR